VLAGLVFLALQVAFGAATQLFTGGEWGPRELLPAFPSIVASALAGVVWKRRSDADVGDADVGARRNLRARIAAGIVIPAGLLSTALGVWLLHQQKTEALRLQDLILSAPTDVVITTVPVLAPHLAGLFSQRSILLVQEEAVLLRVLGSMEARSMDDFLFVTMPGQRAPRGCRQWSRQRGRRVHYSDADLFLCDVTAVLGRHAAGVPGS